MSEPVYRCYHCKEPLMLFQDIQSTVHLVCPVCHASGVAKQVIEQGAGLTPTRFSHAQGAFIQARWAESKLHAW